MKLPKAVTIGGVEWKVKENKNSGGGEFSGKNFTIIIGTKYPQEVPMIFLHEVLEAVMTERCHRYSIYDDTNEKLLFSFDHAEFVNIAIDLALALKKVL